jgi:predicted permease
MSEIPTIIVYWMILMTGILGVFLGSFIGKDKIQKQAIRAGVAYYTNYASGTVEFKWKECK